MCETYIILKHFTTHLPHTLKCYVPFSRRPFTPVYNPPWARSTQKNCSPRTGQPPAWGHVTKASVSVFFVSEKRSLSYPLYKRQYDSFYSENSPTASIALLTTPLLFTAATTNKKNFTQISNTAVFNRKCLRWKNLWAPQEDSPAATSRCDPHRSVWAEQTFGGKSETRRTAEHPTRLQADNNQQLLTLNGN